jgi:hypothetical protein
LVVLANVFNTTLAIHERFDLKGSSYKRTLGRLRGTPGLVCLLISALYTLGCLRGSARLVWGNARGAPYHCHASCSVIVSEACGTSITPGCGLGGLGSGV